MPDFERIAPDTLRMERVLDAPIHTVWRWLVEPELRRLWFAGGTTPQADGEIELVFDHDNLSANRVPYPPQYAQWQGATSRERVVRLEPPRLLAFTWDEGKEGVATFELFELGTPNTSGADPQRHQWPRRMRRLRRRLALAPRGAQGAAVGRQRAGLLGAASPIGGVGGRGPGWHVKVMMASPSLCHTMSGIAEPPEERLR